MAIRTFALSALAAAALAACGTTYEEPAPVSRAPATPPAPVVTASPTASSGSSATPVALVRVEQLFPWADAEIDATLRRFPRAERVVWAQEEPANMGAWTFVRERIQDALRPPQQLAYAGRRASASPAAGSPRIHKQQQELLVEMAFRDLA